ncbi:hypothetical protein PVL29_009645 [Vitis rotundifolia]|uniref:Uncharacterized protein n=1 Tax=Vitis rotundifolia TaxID=103349 RepID=A0AA38ZRC6_VITRO|nr:hypothetical protein PVL29_009645 [Vitis rotundifolia]
MGRVEEDVTIAMAVVGVSEGDDRSSGTGSGLRGEDKNKGGDSLGSKLEEGGQRVFFGWFGEQAARGVVSGTQE